MLTAILILCFVNTASIAALVGLKIYDNSRYETVIEDALGQQVDNKMVSLLSKLM